MTERIVSKEQQHSGEIAIMLLSIGAISVTTDRTFTWSSGLKTPVYSDLRLLMSRVKDRQRVADLLANKVSSIGKVDGIAGTATAGIPHAAWVAERLRLPMVYARGSQKNHGKENRVEGEVKEGERLVVIEDTISTGRSSIESAEALRDEGATCEDIVSIFNYKLPISEQNFRNANLRLHSLTDFPTVIQIAIQNGLWSNEQVLVAKEWYEAPVSWNG